MKSFIIYNVDGIIIRTGSCVDSDFDIQAGDGEFVMEGIADDLCHMILDGQIVDKPEIIVSDYEIKAEVAALLRSKRNSLLSYTIPHSVKKILLKHKLITEKELHKS